ncbi:MAG: ABC transporter ATP-binding protein [Actinomycetota bacterium]|jgi:ABC-2 type transport system ATP-binding protein|nr:ABC transporter ATP-binding protein [Actinomycetota bacterium]
MRPSIRLTGLTKVYEAAGVRAVDGIDLEVGQGELFGLLGPNGAGKTTIVGMCTTRVLPTGGRVEVDGVDVVAHPAGVRRRIGVVTQYNTLDRACTVAENIYYHCRFFGMGKASGRQRTDRLLEQFRLADRAEAMPDELSGGMAQRLQVARAIAHHPQVLFLDEPTAGLDPQSRIALWDIVADLRRAGITVLLTTHYMEEAEQLCERVAIIDQGRILVCDTPASLVKGLNAGRVVLLALDSRDAGLMTRLGAIEGVTEVQPTDDGGVRLLAATANGRLLPQVVEAAQPNGVRDLAINDPSLETVFISLTGRELRD